MVNCEIIRTKIVQLTYAYYQNGNHNMGNAEKELLFCLSKAYHLYIYLLQPIVTISREERHRVEINTQRAEGEGTEMPLQKLALSKFTVQLEENKVLSDFIEEQKLVWDGNVEFIRKICNQIEQSKAYQVYMSDTDDSYEADREVWRKLYKQLIQDNPELDALLEEKSLYWNDGKEVVDIFVPKTIRRFDQADKVDQGILPEYKDGEGRDFATKLFRATTLSADTYQLYMSKTSRSWDFSRLAYMDVVIMRIAVAEMLTFPNIPVSVTIYEYVNQAKRYNTTKSGGYINGMLDSIARHLISTGKMLKPMSEPKQRRSARREKTPDIEQPTEGQE